MSVSIIPIPALNDNYIWALVASDGAQALIIDPGEAKPVLEWLQTSHIKLAAILVTHRHWDHVTGIRELQEQWQCPVYGPNSDAIPQVTQPVQEGARLRFWGELEFVVWETPGHTTEHISYLLTSLSPYKLFCGDTLFAAGCGRLLGGTAEQLHHSLQRFAGLPDNTQIYCTHEYTLSNLRFANAVEPFNENIKNRLQLIETKRKSGICTLPSNLLDERLTNPFLRCHEPDVVQKVTEYAGTELSTNEQIFAHLRGWKDRF